MGNVQVRLPDDLEDALEALAGELHTSRSEVMRNALEEGLASIRLERALSQYTRGEMSLEAAARYAGVSLARLAASAADRGIPYARYSVEEAEADRRTAAELLEERDEERTEEEKEPGKDQGNEDEGDRADSGSSDGG